MKMRRFRKTLGHEFTSFGYIDVEGNYVNSTTFNWLYRKGWL